jgi:hypothetical protein
MSLPHGRFRFVMMPPVFMSSPQPLPAISSSSRRSRDPVRVVRDAAI